MNQTTSSPVHLRLITLVLLAPLLFFAARGMFSFDRAQYGNSATVDAGVSVDNSDTIYYRIQRFAVYGVAIVVMALSLKGTYRLARRHLFLFSLPALALISTVWSQEPLKTLPLAVMATCLTLLGVWMTYRFQYDEQIDLFNLVGVVATLSSYILVLFLPSAGIRHTDASAAWQGLFVHKNALGMVTLYFLATAYYADKRTALTSFLYKAYVGAMLVLIVMSLSRTAWLELLLVIFYFAFEALYIRTGKMEKAVLPAIVGILAIAMTIVAFTYREDIAVALGKTPDMTGRSGIFEAIYPSLWKRPVTGFGYQAFWIGLHGESANILLTPGHTTLANAENGLLQMWLELGALGTGIIVILLLVSVRNALFCLRMNPTKFARWNCSIVFLSLLMLVNGDKYMYPDTIEWLLFVIAYINLAEEVRCTKEAFAMARSANPAASRLTPASSPVVLQ